MVSNNAGVAVVEDFVQLGSGFSQADVRNWEIRRNYSRLMKLIRHYA